MTMRPILLASTFVVATSAGASAQSVPSLPPLPAVPPVPAAPAVPVHFDAHVPFATVDWTAHMPDFTHLEHTVSLAMAKAQEKANVVIQPPGTNQPFKIFTAGGGPDQWYSQARSYIDRNQYDRAMDPLDRVISAKGDRADAAMYWKAYSQLKLARRDEALSTLSQLQKQYPMSRWLGDARALEVEIKQAAGQPVSPDADNDDLKLLALQGILRTDPEAAFPVVEKMLMGGASVRVKERALFVLSQNRSERAQQIIANVARGTSNPDVQLTAIRTLGISNSPDAINALTTTYRADSSVDVKKAIINALASSRNTAAITSLVTLARAERNPELKTSMVRHLSNSSNPEAKAFMLELLK
jgi:tetratricopeptide (TPR) repeat protein